jgi:acetolactate synthase-1/2/3 large subunit
VTTVLLNNRAYAILRLELNRVGAQAADPAVQELLSLDNPAMDFVAISEGLGVPAQRVRTTVDLAEALTRAFKERGPHLIEVVIDAPF